MTRVVFLGSPEAAVPSLVSVAAAHDVLAVVTQPDRPKGRSGRPVPTPVKETALVEGLTVLEPASRSELFEAIDSVGPFELGVVVAYGRLLGPEVLALASTGFLNVHFSLLPRWRGAAPVERALMAGDTMTGVTIIELDEGLDTGPVLTAQAVDIEPGENAGSLTRRLAEVGGRLLVSVIPQYLTGELEPIPQSDEGAVYAGKITAADRSLDPHAARREIVDHVRALSPEPGATLSIDGVRHKILDARPHEASPPPGTWIGVGGVPVVGTSDGGVELVTLQPPGKTPQEGAAWLRGRRSQGGEVG